MWRYVSRWLHRHNRRNFRHLMWRTELFHANQLGWVPKVHDLLIYWILIWNDIMISTGLLSIPVFRKTSWRNRKKAKLRDFGRWRTLRFSIGMTPTGRIYRIRNVRKTGWINLNLFLNLHYRLFRFVWCPQMVSQFGLMNLKCMVRKRLICLYLW